MTDISKEVVERFYVVGTEVKGEKGDFVHYSDYAALSARVAELEAETPRKLTQAIEECSDAFERGRLQGLDEASKAIGEVPIPIGQTKTIWDAQDAIDALKQEAGQ